MSIQVLARLAAADPWGFTVLDTLKRRLGYAGVAAVHRIRGWELVFDTDGPESAIQTTERILHETALLANPNRDLWVVRSAADGVLPSDFWIRTPGSGDAFVIEVTDKEDLVGRSMLRILRSRLRIAEIENVRHATIWIIEFENGYPAERVAGEIAVAKSWRKGLLANPHCQNAEVHRLETYFREKARSA
jgi:phosphoribosylformylglycinamidine (FGAM) synthase PurS component